MGASSRLLAKRAANTWLLRLREGELSDDERAQFEAWLAADPAHDEAFARVSGAVGGLAALASSGVPGERSAALRALLAERAKPRRRAATAAVALAACLVLAFGVGYWSILPPTYQTALGQQRDIVLTDGTRVELNTHTRLQVRYVQSERRIVLIRGEAMFDVVSDPTRPFIVEAEGRQVRAVGTAFTVRVDEAGLHVLVVEGAVAVAELNDAGAGVRAADAQAPLRAGQALTIVDAQPKLTELPEAELARSLSWRSGMLQFDGQRLDAAVAEVARYTGARFVIEDPGVGATPVWAYFPAADLDGFLSGLEQNAPELAITRNGKDVRIARQSQH